MLKPSLLAIPLLSAALGCSPSDSPLEGPQAPEAVNFSSQVYVISEESDELFVIDVEPSPPVAVGFVNTNLLEGESNANHMAIVSGDGQKVYITATHRDAIVVVDRKSMEVIDSIAVGAHPTHASLRPGSDELWVVNEDSGSVSVIDTSTDEVVVTIAHSSMVVPHQVRWDAAAAFAFVPSIGGNQITVVDGSTYQVQDVLVPEGMTEGECAGDPCGFADAQVDPNGLLYAAHIETGRLLVFDTVTMSVVDDLQLGPQPWIAYVDQFDGPSTLHYVVPNLGDSSLSIIDAQGVDVEGTLPEGDTETYGVNYSPLAPGLAFVMNRNREEVTVIDVDLGTVVHRIEIDATVETACTTDDGRYIVAPLSSTDEVAVIDVQNFAVVARFQGVGSYPWSAATLGGQNYCH